MRGGLAVALDQIAAAEWQTPPGRGRQTTGPERGFRSLTHNRPYRAFTLSNTILSLFSMASIPDFGVYAVFQANAVPKSLSGTESL
jgi:hypothetical protein